MHVRLFKAQADFQSSIFQLITTALCLKNLLKTYMNTNFVQKVVRILLFGRPGRSLFEYRH